jgi:hypothetical protein
MWINLREIAASILIPLHLQGKTSGSKEVFRNDANFGFPACL